MTTRALRKLAVWIGLGSAYLGAAGCGPTCPKTDPNCGTGNASVAGAAGSSSSSSGSCAALTALNSCMKAFCATATNPFCTCFNQNKDLNTASCMCVAFDPERFCDEQAATGAAYDCSAAIGAVATACIGVPQG